jgi:hypothetical protein
MVARLRKRDKTETLTFEVFNLELDEADHQRLAEDPRGFLGSLLESEGATVNGLYLESDESFQTIGTAERPRGDTTVWHCVRPPDMRSNYIVVVSRPRRVASE